MSCNNNKLIVRTFFHIRERERIRRFRHIFWNSYWNITKVILEIAISRFSKGAFSKLKKKRENKNIPLKYKKCVHSPSSLLGVTTKQGPCFFFFLVCARCDFLYFWIITLSVKLFFFFCFLFLFCSLLFCFYCCKVN